MKFPIKPHDSFWPNWLRPLLGAHLRKDPRLLLQTEKLSEKDFSKAVSNFRLGGTFKTTRPGRHALSNELLRQQNLPPDTVILELGASDGITSLELMQSLDFRFKRYYVTDRFLTVTCLKKGKQCYFFNSQNECILIADTFFVYYPKLSPLTQKLYGKRIKEMENKIKKCPTLKTSTPLIHPRLKKEQDKRPDQIYIRSHDMLKPWTEEQPTLIKAANLLNPGYFSQKHIRLALKLIFDVLPENGLFLLVENRILKKDKNGKSRQEAAALWQKQNQRFQLVEKVGPKLQLQVEKLL